MVFAFLMTSCHSSSNVPTAKQWLFYWLYLA